jgi:hypothetical protein
MHILGSKVRFARNRLPTCRRFMSNGGPPGKAAYAKYSSNRFPSSGVESTAGQFLPASSVPPHGRKHMELQTEKWLEVGTCNRGSNGKNGFDSNSPYSEK